MDTYLSRAKKDFADKPLAIGPLMQMFQIEALPLRTALVETLAAFSSKESSQALAKLAVFDLSPQVRYDAINALKKRKPAEVRPVFLAAFRHVWAPAADHAAHALVEIGDHEARGPLKKLLEAPPPDAPYQKDGKWHQRELVRVNHLANCFLCHSPSTEGPDRGKDSVFATVPVPGQRLPEVYYASRIRRASPSFIRADVVYFRQDFSVMHAVKDAKPWPEVQRFDYLVREKPLTDRQLVAARAAGRRKAPGDYPQLRAVKDALTELNRLPLVAAKK